MYISKVKVRNWRNFTDVEVSLEDTVFLIGPNASGKSNFLDIFRFLRDIANPEGGGLQKAISSRGGLKKIRSLAARRYTNVDLEIELNDASSTDGCLAEPDWKYVLSIKNEKSGKRRILVAKEEVYRDGERILARPNDDDKRDPVRLTQTYIEQINMNNEFREITEFFQQVLYLHLIPQLLKFGGQVSIREMESDPFGQGFLEHISATPSKPRDSRLKRIEALLKEVIPFFRELRFVKDDITGAPHLEMRYVHWRPRAGWQREDQFSDGTLRLIALGWTLLSFNSLILLEEPEISLHTKIVEQIPELVSKWRKSRKKAGGQILISTHSESLLSGSSIDGGFLILKPGGKGAPTRITQPSEDDRKALRSGMTPADILLPQTNNFIKNIPL
ncbi:MAG: AAA family ATPase [Pseudomonadota bacterium]